MNETNIPWLYDQVKEKSFSQVARETSVSRHAMDKLFQRMLTRNNRFKLIIEREDENPRSNGSSFHEIVSAIQKDPPVSRVNPCNGDSVPASCVFKFLSV